MIDTLNIELRQQDAPGINFRRVVLPALRNVKEVQYKEHPKQYYISGDFFGLRCYVSNKAIAFKGSIHKFIKYNNIEPITRQEIADLFTSIKEHLGLPLESAIVRRVDVGAALVVENPPRRYIDVLGKLEGFSCNPYSGGGVYYSDRGGSDTGLCIYDKIAEMRENHRSIPPDYAGRYILRYELRHMKGHAPGIPGRIQTVEQLLTPDTYNALCREWARRFKEINKITALTDMKHIQTVKAANLIGARMVIEAVGGLEAILERIDAARAAGYTTSKQAYDLRKLYKAAAAYNDMNPEAEELEEKIRLALLAGGVPPEDEEPHDIEAAG